MVKKDGAHRMKMSFKSGVFKNPSLLPTILRKRIVLIRYFSVGSDYYLS